MSIDRLKAIVAPPDCPLDAGTAELWPEVERTLGTVLPEDYKQLINLYGVGLFGNWIYVNSPFSSWFLLGEPELLKFIVSGRDELPEYHHPFFAFPEPGGLLPWGGDDNAGLFCWLTHGLPNDWITVNLDNHYSEEYQELPYSITELLAGWLMGEIVGDWYPNDLLLSQRQIFTPGGIPNRF